MKIRPALPTLFVALQNLTLASLSRIDSIRRADDQQSSLYQYSNTKALTPMPAPQRSRRAWRSSHVVGRSSKRTWPMSHRAARGEIFGLEAIGTIGTAGTIGTGFFLGVCACVIPKASSTRFPGSKRWTASICRSNGKFFPTIPDDSMGFEDSKAVSGSRDAKHWSQDLSSELREP
jgi:hypothetical protein